MGIFDKLFGDTAKDSKSDKELEWLNLGSVEDLDAAIAHSFEQTVLLFKHSTRCSISSSALDRLTRKWNGEEVFVRTFYLDLLNHRDISSTIASKLNIEHQSPQMILVKDGVAIFNSSHMNIDFEDVKEYAPAN